MKRTPTYLQLTIDNSFNFAPKLIKLNDAHIMYYGMDATGSVGLVWTDITHPDFVAVQASMHTTFLYPDLINQTGPCLIDMFFRRPGLHASGHPYDIIMAIVNNSDAAYSLLLLSLQLYNLSLIITATLHSVS